jgi:hypothetical protein
MMNRVELMKRGPWRQAHCAGYGMRIPMLPLS